MFQICYFLIYNISIIHSNDDNSDFYVIAFLATSMHSSFNLDNRTYSNLSYIIAYSASPFQNGSLSLIISTTTGKIPFKHGANRMLSMKGNVTLNSDSVALRLQTVFTGSRSAKTFYVSQ